MSELCEACSVFNISRERFRSSPFSEKLMHQLGWFFDVEKRTYCPLCTLVTKAFRDGPVQDREAFEGSRVQGSWVKISEGKPDAGLQFWSMGKHENLKVELSVRLLPENDEEPSIGMGVLIDSKSPQIPIDRVKNWLHRCEHDHSCRSVPLASTRAGRMPLTFTVIDVEDMCLIEPEDDVRFLALSYVWGSSNRFTSSLPAMRALSKDKSIENVLGQLAPSIRDAIELTRKLGEKYLWTDALCVSQSGDMGKEMAKDNIASMDSIYRHAAYVIVAADDDAPDNGIAGLSTLGRKVKQHTAEIVPGVRVLARFSPQMYMSHSLYRTRGWTYQEEQLANRSLIFVNNQVYFSCPNFAYSEDIEAERNDAPDDSLAFQQKTGKILYQDANPTAVYFRSVEEYTQRNFRYPDDIIKGFSGVAAVQSQILASTVLEGLPTSFFDAALLWQPVGALKRREGFPSWSWAGWHGAVRWLGDTVEGMYLGPEPALDTLNSWIRKRTFLRLYHLNKHRQVEPVWEPRTRTPIGKMFWSTSEENDPSPAVGYTGDFNENAPFEQDDDAEEQVYLEATGLELAYSKDRVMPLLFKTLVVTFRIQASAAYLRYGTLDPAWDPNGRAVFLLLNKNDAVSGYVLLDEATWRPHDMSTQQFLLLSEANYWCEWGRPHENHPYKKTYDMEAWNEYHVMMVTHKTLESSGLPAVERAGIGRLLKEAVKDAHGEASQAENVILV